MKHVIETLQHTVYFMSVVFVYEMISVQHSSATCATYFSGTELVSMIQHDHETNVTFQLFLIVSVHSMLDSCVTNVWYG